MGEDTTTGRTLGTPAEMWRALEETSAAWQSLRNNAFGRSVSPPKVSDAATKIRERIAVDFEQWKRWRDELGAFDAITMTWGSELAEWRDRYQQLARDWSNATGRTVVWLPKVKGMGQASADAVKKVVEDVGAGSGLIVLALGVLYLFLQKPAAKSTKRIA